MSCPKVTVFADQDVGLDVVKYLHDEHKSDLVAIITVEENDIFSFGKRHGINSFTISSLMAKEIGSCFLEVDLIFLAWWPKLISKEIINTPKLGVVNFHPSLLPYNRGKHYNFWTLVEGSPFGVSLHFVDEGIDSGDVLFQAEINKDWEDNGESLYLKAKLEIVRLFKATYPLIISGEFKRFPQDLEKGSIHYARELDPASKIYLDKEYRCRDLLNLLRARTFPGMPACYFYDDGKKYEVKISIKEVTNGSS